MENLNQITLIEELYKNSLVSVNHLAQILPMARQTITKIKQELWKKQFIFSPSIILNPNLLDLHHYFIELAGNPTDSEILTIFLPIPEINSIDLVLGDFSLLIQLTVFSKHRFREILAIIDQAIDNRLFTDYRIFQPLEFYKLGGFILDRSENILPLTPNQWDDIQLLRKNFSVKHWNLRQSDLTKLTPFEVEKLNSFQLKKERDINFQKGIIRAFSITLTKPTFDFSFKYFLRIRPKIFRDYAKIAEILSHNPHVVDLYRIDAESGIFATFRVKSLYQLKEFIFSLYDEFEVDKTFTTLVMQEIIPNIHPPSIKVAKILSDL